MLDGMVYGGLDAKTRVIVTTDSLFKHWLNEHKDWWGKTGDMPQEPSAAVKANNFYTQAVLTDSAILHFADLPHPQAGRRVVRLRHAGGAHPGRCAA